MLRLILLRHAKAAAHEEGGDAERPLTKRGRRDALRVGDYLAGQQLFPDLALVSPAKRTRETLELALDNFGEPVPAEAEPALYHAAPADLLAAVRATPGFVRLLLVVGHNPGLSEVATLLTGHGAQPMRARMEAGFPTSAFAIIDFEAAKWADVSFGSGLLQNFVTPQDLAD